MRYLCGDITLYFKENNIFNQYINIAKTNNPNRIITYNDDNRITITNYFKQIRIVSREEYDILLKSQGLFNLENDIKVGLSKLKDKYGIEYIVEHDYPNKSHFIYYDKDYYKSLENTNYDKDENDLYNKLSGIYINDSFLFTSTNFQLYRYHVTIKSSHKESDINNHFRCAIVLAKNINEVKSLISKEVKDCNLDNLIITNRGSFDLVNKSTIIYNSL